MCLICFFVLSSEVCIQGEKKDPRTLAMSLSDYVRIEKVGEGMSLEHFKLFNVL